MYSFLKKVGFQFFGVVAVIMLLGIWQTRNLPSGPAPKLEVTPLSPTVKDFDSSRHSNVKLIYFFAPWCSVCKLSVPGLNSLQSWFPDLDIQLIALDFENKEDVENFVSIHDVKVTTKLGSDDVRRDWHIDAYPTYFILDHDRKIRGVSIGYSPALAVAAKVLWAKYF